MSPEGSSAAAIRRGVSGTADGPAALGSTPDGYPLPMTPSPEQRHGSGSPPEQEGEVSEVSGLSKAAEPISPGDSVAGSPSQESGQVDEGPTGPDAATHDPRQSQRRAKGDVETTG